MGLLKSFGNKLKDNKGTVLIKSLVFVIVIMMVSALVIEYYRLYIITDRVKSAVNSAVVDTATLNSYAAFGGVREGDSSIYSKTDNVNWQNAIVYNDIEDALVKELGLIKSQNYLLRKSPSEDLIYIYSIREINVTAQNPNHMPGIGEEVVFDISYKLRVSMLWSTKIGHGLVMYLNYDIKSSSHWQPFI